MPRVGARSTSASSSNIPCPTTPQTAAERARERKLRDDPMAVVVSPMHVDCKRCGSRIKLSSKSPYDTFHWRTHRTRCLKKRDGTKKVRKTKNASLSPRDSLLSPPNEPQKRCEKISEPESQILVCKGSRDLEVIKDDSHSANNLNLLTSVANAVLKRSGYLSHPRKEFAKSSPRQWRWSQRNSPEGRDSDLGWRGFQEGMDELRMRQEAIESLALLSRSG